MHGLLFGINGVRAVCLQTLREVRIKLLQLFDLLPQFAVFDSILLNQGLRILLLHFFPFVHVVAILKPIQLSLQFIVLLLQRLDLFGGLRAQLTQLRLQNLRFGLFLILDSFYLYLRSLYQLLHFRDALLEFHELVLKHLLLAADFLLVVINATYFIFLQFDYLTFQHLNFLILFFDSSLVRVAGYF